MDCYKEKLKLAEEALKSEVYDEETIEYIFPELKDRTIILSELSFHKIQDILEELELIDENGKCPYTAEEIFRAGLEYSIGRIIKEERE